jgi:hypothetical protein
LLKYLPSIVASLLVLWVPVAGSAAALPPALPDQLGGSAALTDLPPGPVLVIVVNVRRLRHVQRWEEALRAALPDLQSLRVADVAQEPKPQLADVAGTLARRAPAGVPILIDLDNAWARQFELNTREPCLLLFDSGRELVAHWRGRARAELVSEVLAGIQALEAPAAATGAEVAEHG